MKDSKIKNIVIGCTNLTVGVSVAVFSPFIAIALLFLLMPFAVIEGVSRAIKDILIDYPATVMKTVCFGFKIGDTAFRRFKQQTKPESEG